MNELKWKVSKRTKKASQRILEGAEVTYNDKHFSLLIITVAKVLYYRPQLDCSIKH
jgi:hypothetical protein